MRIAAPRIRSTRKRAHNRPYRLLRVRCPLEQLRPPLSSPTAAEQAAKLLADYQRSCRSQLQIRTSDTFLLASEDGRLQRSNVYRVVFHRAWIQPVPDRDRLRRC